MDYLLLRVVLLILYILFIGVVLCGGLQDSQGDQPLADGTLLFKTFLSLYPSNLYPSEKHQSAAAQ